MANVLLLFGGRGAEREISRRSAAAVLHRTLPSEFSYFPVEIDKTGDFFYRTPPAPASVDLDAFGTPAPARLYRKDGAAYLSFGSRRVKIDVAFPVLHGDYGEDGRVQGFLSALGVPFVGVDTPAGAFSTDKETAKLFARHLGIPTLPWLSFSDIPAREALTRAKEVFGQNLPPLFIKPACLGSSVGAYRAPDEETFLLRYPKAAKYGKVLVEQEAHRPKEIECGYLSIPDKTLLLGPGQITSYADFYDYGDKYETHKAEILTRARIPEEVSRRVREYTLQLVRALGVRDLARVDFFYTAAGELYFNEINPIPGLTDASLFPRLTAAAGISFSEAVNALLRQAYARGV